MKSLRVGTSSCNRESTVSYGVLGIDTDEKQIHRRAHANLQNHLRAIKIERQRQEFEMITIDRNISGLYQYHGRSSSFTA